MQSMKRAWCCLVPALCLVLPQAARAADAGPPASHEPVGNEVIEGWLDSVVLLLTGNAWCSGVVIDDKGTVATAYHCVANGLRPSVRVRFDEDARFVGRTIAAAAKEDIALVSVPELAGKVPPLQIREEVVARGDRVYGIGHPFAPAAEKEGPFEGMLLWSVTEGIISAVGPRLIQTDAALNPGNSGGPVVDNQGRIVGIASRKLAADNIAFLASAQVLRELVAEPRRPALLGGQWFAGLSFWAPGDYHAAPTAELYGGLLVRDRFLLQAGLNTAGTARQAALERGDVWYPSFEASAGLRLRLGRGSGSTTLDVGGGAVGTRGMDAVFDGAEGTWLVYALEPEVLPFGYGRVGYGGFALRLMSLLRERTLGNEVLPMTMVLAIDLDLPGVFATF